MELTIPNLKSWSDGITRQLDAFEVKIVDARREVARALTESLASNIPVWSGRTLRSVHATNSGSPLPVENHPDRGDTSSEGPYRFHQEFGATSKMPLGSEPMRGSAYSTALASLDSVTYDLSQPLYITISSTAAMLANVAAAPTSQTARNHAVVTELAKAQVKAMFPYLKGG